LPALAISLRRGLAVAVGRLPREIVADVAQGGGFEPREDIVAGHRLLRGGTVALPGVRLHGLRLRGRGARLDRLPRFLRLIGCAYPGRLWLVAARTAFHRLVRDGTRDLRLLHGQPAVLRLAERRRGLERRTRCGIRILQAATHR